MRAIAKYLNRLAASWRAGLRFGTGAAILLLCASPLLAGIWEPIGPNGGAVFSIARHPADPRIVYAGTFFGGMYISDDAGINWKHLSSPFSNKVVFSIAVNAGAPDTVYAGTFEGGVFRSDDRGATWNAVNTGLTSLNVLSLAISPTDSNRLVSATHGGIFLSEDGGQSWSASTTANIQATTVVFDIAIPDTVYSGTLSDGVLRSSDGGVSWSSFNNGLTGGSITSLAYDPDAAGVIYASTASGVFVLGPGQQIWQDLTLDLAADTLRINQILPRSQDDGIFLATSSGVYLLPDSAATSWRLWAAGDVRLLLSNSATGITHLAASAAGMFVTGDDGQTFFPAIAGIQNRFAGAIATLDATGNTAIFAGIDEGLEWTSELFSSGGSLSWFNGFQSEGAIFGITTVPASPGTIYAGSERRGVWRSIDYGATWAPAADGLVPREVNALAQSPVGTNKLYAATSSGLFISDDDGTNWAPYENAVVLFPVETVAADPVRPNVAWFGNADGQVYRSFDGKNFFPTWQHPGNASIWQIVASRYFNIYLVTYSGELYASDDVGGTFVRRAETEIPEHVLSVAVDPERPWIVYVGTVFGGVYKSDTNAINWEQKNNGITIPIISALAVDSNVSTTVYAGSRGVIYKSTDGGNQWQEISIGVPDAQVLAIEVDPNNSSTVLATVEGNGILRSTDAGLNWSAIASAVPQPGYTPLLAAKTSADTWFIGGANDGVFKSVDGGDNWNAVSDGMSLFVRSVVADPTNPARLYAGTLSAGVFRSDDSAGSWSYTGLDDRNVFDLAVDPGNPLTVYAGNSRGGARSLDGGDTWADVGNKTAWSFDIVVDPASSNTLYAAGIFGRVFHSTDTGLTWETLNTGLPNVNLLSAAIDTSGRLLVGTEGSGLYRITAGGPAVDMNLPILPGTLIMDVVVGASPQTIYVATNGEGLWQTINDGLNWTRIDQGFTSDIVAEVSVDPFNSNRLIAALLLPATMTGSSLFVSDDAGAVWVPTTIAGVGVSAVRFSPATADTIYAATANGVVKSEDGGSSWTDLNAGLAGVAINALSVDPYQPDRVVAGDSAGNIYTSLNNAAWQVSGNSNPGSVQSLTFGATSDRIYAATMGSGVLQSADGGLSWGQGFSTGLQSVPVLAVAVDPSDSQVLYAATGGAGLLKSTDGGLNWERKDGVTANSLLSIIINPQQPATIYVGSAEAGFFASDDGGENWVSFNLGLFNQSVTSLAFDANNSSVIYAGTEGGGVFRWLRE